jgi:hypothetical protein
LIQIYVILYNHFCRLLLLESNHPTTFARAPPHTPTTRDYIKNSGDHPESATWGLDWIGYTPGKREGRRFIGQYVMKQNDISSDPGAKVPQEPVLFWDRISYGGWPFDLHNPKGMRDPEHKPNNSTEIPYMYSTPLRSLISKDISNLFFAGRLASFSHVVYGSQRVMKTCATMGQAVGTAAAYCTKFKVAASSLKGSPQAVWSIQQQLLRDDQFIIGVKNEDPRDHARSATVSVADNNEQEDGKGANVISGQSRAVVWTHGVSFSLCPFQIWKLAHDGACIRSLRARPSTEPTAGSPTHSPRASH